VKAQKGQDEFSESEDSRRRCYGKRAFRLVAVQTGQRARLPGQKVPVFQLGVSAMTKNADKIIVALDVPTKKEALALVEQVREQISFFKIGLQLYTAEGPEIVRAVLATGAKVFLDLKLHDIPNTVARAVESAAQLGAQMLTIHLCGGSEMIRAAVNARSGDMLLLGVTMLTSADERTLSELGISDKIDNRVLRLARLGVGAGIDGLIASAREVKMLRQQIGDKIKIVVQGIRPSWSDRNDQKRVMTPREALDSGADYLGIGRPITTHSSPRDAVSRILAELAVKEIAH
jgi:orotidine-5'-phosphate decarboxylase